MLVLDILAFQVDKWHVTVWILHFYHFQTGPFESLQILGEVCSLEADQEQEFHVRFKSFYLWWIEIICFCRWLRQQRLEWLSNPSKQSSLRESVRMFPRQSPRYTNRRLQPSWSSLQKRSLLGREETEQPRWDHVTCVESWLADTVTTEESVVPPAEHSSEDQFRVDTMTPTAASRTMTARSRWGRGRTVSSAGTTSVWPLEWRRPGSSARRSGRRNSTEEKSTGSGNWQKMQVVSVKKRMILWLTTIW